MAIVRPFAAIRPDPARAARICELPYDVLSSAEARAAAAGNPLSFFHVSKPEIDLEPTIRGNDDRVYAQGKSAFQNFLANGLLKKDAQPCFYLYRQIMGRHSQVGLVAVTSCQEYLDNRIRKHELTRPDKEDDRVRHIDALNAQTGPAFLIYPEAEALATLFQAKTQAPPEVDFVAPDQVRHTSWTIADRDSIDLIQRQFASFPALYIADGHHRSAAAARIFQQRHGAGSSSYFLSVLFPENQVQILPYHRVLKDLNGLSESALLEKLSRVFLIEQPGQPEPPSPRAVSFYMAGVWRTLQFRSKFGAATDPLRSLDVSLLQSLVLAPVFGIDDPRTSHRIHFIGGIRGPGELERQVNSGEFACAFSMFPTRVQDLVEIAELGGLMPPKSTWFEPKLRDGLFSHDLE